MQRNADPEQLKGPNMTNPTPLPDSEKIDPAYIEKLRAELRAEMKYGGLGPACERKFDPEENSRFIDFLATMPYFGEDDIIEEIVNEGRVHVPR
jgi:hypothetical protein